MAEKFPEKPDPRPADAGATVPLSSPYGPHYQGVDEAAGGADSSPLETEPTGEQREKAADQNPPHGDDRSP
jgi:hypothetical protein